ncbi:oxygen-dependent protoporphyrinogen oxidase [Ophidiomyces ophidiicola]|nr:oxygen-dependent protoporphyrinogen oxidase [Ophidiomyces ophidiicola]KAI2135547.1 oxygen-dependent protoporphyrinogen oxidase [Ophidiomyces ophidiicola]KAI2137773.1 oxygen-dependent protoporphyrinogen oxidase [Ophidiomyces ophidiicola]KAI2215708.1 oxygen-dependent protoporphyrinogen oxidase [Ophidiomyces ophidiicola]KAI2348548.1 oxygen-dependent protoporphyrinogen oxidase [Ophidiomyces ophidiicola]
MRPRCSSAHAVEELWRFAHTNRIHTRPLFGSFRRLRAPWRSQFSSTAHNEAKNVAIIGGGITGLSTAYRLSKDPLIKVTLFESSNRLGGWIRSEKIDVGDGKYIVFDDGPRTLRSTLSGALATLELIKDLDLQKEILRTSIHDAASRNRYIYYPDHLVRLPGPQPGAGLLVNIISNFMNLFTEPALKNIPLALLSEYFVPKRDMNVRDESIGDFLSRRFGKDLTDHLASAVIHGIYAGDIYKLSAQSLLPKIWWSELSKRGICLSMQDNHLPYDIFHGGRLIRRERGIKFMSELSTYISGSSVFALKGGMGQLVDALSSALNSSPNVEIKTNADVNEMRRGDSGWQISVGDTARQNYSHVVSTIPFPKLQGQLGSDFEEMVEFKDIDLHSDAATVMTVNLYFKSSNLVPVHGFGYLIPRSIPLEQNPERALGVVFMSDSNIGQDTARGTKLTVMLGGHWWSHWEDSELPSEEKGIEMARKLLKRHLQITEEPVVARAKLMKQAIPQYTVGHATRMADLHEILMQEAPGLKVAGSWFTGVAVNDCIRAARLTANSILSGNDEETGLERYLDDNIEGYGEPS